MCQRIFEYPVRFRGGKIVFPAIEVLVRLGKPPMRNGEYKALLTCQDDDVMTFIEWVADTMPERCRIMGLFAFEEMDYRIDREFKGVCVYFNTAVDAVHFRLAWSDFYSPQQTLSVAA